VVEIFEATFMDRPPYGTKTTDNTRNPPFFLDTTNLMAVA